MNQRGQNMATNYDIYQHSIHRTVHSDQMDGKNTREVVIESSYNIKPKDLWADLSIADRIEKWFAPVTGELKLHGEYQIQGNAQGTITTCDPFKLIELTWDMFGDQSWLKISLIKEQQRRTRLILSHKMFHSPHYESYGSGATGVGWEMAFLGLHLHIAHPEQAKLDEEEFAYSDEGRRFIRQSSEGWKLASIAGGEDPQEATQAAQNTTAFYTGESQSA